MFSKSVLKYLENSSYEIKSRHIKIKSILHINDYFARKFIYFGQVEAYFQMFTQTRKLSEIFPVCTRKAQYIGYFGP